MLRSMPYVSSERMIKRERVSVRMSMKILIIELSGGQTQAHLLELSVSAHR